MSKKTIKCLFSLLALIFLGTTTQQAWAQKEFKAYQLNINKTNEKIKVDGQLDDKIWQNLEKVGDFYQNFPFDTSYAISKTEVQMSFDEDFLYVAFTCYDNHNSQYIVQSLRRDFDGGANDFVTFYLDTFGDGTNGFTFGITPYGVLREALIFNGDNIDNTWDNKWVGAAKIHQGKWTAEMAIPFSTLRYKADNSNWKINFARIDQKRNEISSWVPVPRNFKVQTLSFTGDVLWAENPPKPGINVAVIPFITGQGTRNYLEEDKNRYSSGFGADAKIAISSSLNLDLTVNPDFSQVEVDQQVTNLSRFEIFFPERRQFFVENSDLFSRFGFSRIRPFFSRRIGIGRDTTTGQIVQNPILYGARLSGKVDKNWRIGLMNMQTARDESAGIEGQNYTVAAVQRQVFGRSNIGMIFVNRQTTSREGDAFSFNIPDFNRVLGIDYNLLSKNNRWAGKFFYHQVFTPNNQANQYAHASFLRYSTRNLEVFWNHEFVGENYTAEVGFVPRRNHWRLEPFMRYRFFPKKENSKINNQSIRLYADTFWDTEGQLNDQTLELGYEIEFTNTVNWRIDLNRTFIRLFSDFDPTNTDGVRLSTGSTFNTYSFSTRFSSDSRKFFSYAAQASYGSYFNGNLTNLNFNLNYRIQPIGNISIQTNYVQINLPEPYSSADFWLIGPRFEFAFTKSLFFNLFTQYNNQINNINLNARLQWRFQPVSDLFIVYSDNYFPEDLKVKNRALVLKLTYWLNI